MTHIGRRHGITCPNAELTVIRPSEIFDSVFTGYALQAMEKDSI